jgi:apolipoprotein N-acyltransferase
MIGSSAHHRTTWPPITESSTVPQRAAVPLAVGAGVAIALSLPPFGWWPLGVAGLGAFAALLRRRGPKARAVVGAGVGFGQYAIGLWWVMEFSGPGYVALLLLGVLFTALAAVSVVSRRWVGIIVGLPAALMATDWVRGHYPFGGLPLGGIPLGQAAGPLVPVARLGGPLLVTGVTAAAGAGLALLAWAVLPVVAHRWRPPVGPEQTPSPTPRPGWRPAAAGAAVLAVVVVLVAAGRFGPDGAGAGPSRKVSVAAVQGGGPRGLHESQVDPSVAFRRQLAAETAVRPPVQLVVWPEDVIIVDQPIGQTPEAATMAQMAQRLGATIVAGVVENVGATQFRNAAVAWSPTGVIVARYDKVHRVPFGEYIPYRSLIEHLANLALVPRDAIAGHGPGLLDTPAAPLGTVISYEVFFEDRSRAAINAGGQLLIVPTNAASYSTSQVPTQEVAAAQLQAWETGRDVLQAAPTGYSALIDHDGRVVKRSTLGRPQVVAGTLTLRQGRTLFLRLGDLPVLALAVIALVAASWLAQHPR